MGRRKTNCEPLTIMQANNQRTMNRIDLAVCFHVVGGRAEIGRVYNSGLFDI